MKQSVLITVSVITLAVVAGVIGLATRKDSASEQCTRTEWAVSPAFTQRLADGGWRFGSPTATKTVVEFADFQCPACGFVYPIVKEVKDTLPADVSMLYKHFPIESKHNKALAAGQVSEAAGKQGKFWEMYDLLFSRQASWQNLSVADFRKTAAGYAAELNLNAEQFACDATSDETKDLVRKDMAAGEDAEVTGTPTFIIGTTQFGSNLPRTADELRAWISATN